MGMALLTILLIACSLPSLALAWRMRRTGRSGDAKHCSRCGFNLTGLPTTGEARCPECGAALAEKKAITIGQPRADGFGMAICLLIAGAFLIGAFCSGRNTDWVAARAPIWPSAWLAEDIEKGRATSPTAIELVRRIQSGSLAGDGRERVLKALTRLTITSRATVRAGERVPVAIDSAPVPSVSSGWRGDSTSPPAFTLYRRLCRYRIGDGEWVRTEHSFEPLSFIGTGVTSFVQIAVPVSHPQGNTNVELDFEFHFVARDQEPTVIDERSGERRPVNHGENDPTTVAWHQLIKRPIQVAPADAEDDVTLVVDPSLRAAVRASIQFGRLYKSGNALSLHTSERGLQFTKSFNDGTVMIDLRVDVDRSPIQLAFDVVVIDPRTGKELFVGSASALASRMTGMGYSRNLDADVAAAIESWPGDRAKVILRPSKKAAREQPLITSIWGEEIVFDDVEIYRRWLDPARKPATQSATRP